jgi:hypothetical protein
MDLISIFFAGRYPLFSATFVEEAAFSPLYVFGFCQNKVGIPVSIHIWVLHSVPLVFMSVFLPVPCFFFLLLICNIV